MAAPGLNQRAQANMNFALKAPSWAYDAWHARYRPYAGLELNAGHSFEDGAAGGRGSARAGALTLTLTPTLALALRRSARTGALTLTLTPTLAIALALTR